MHTNFDPNICMTTTERGEGKERIESKKLQGEEEGDKCKKQNITMPNSKTTHKKNKSSFLH